MRRLKSVGEIARRTWTP